MALFERPAPPGPTGNPSPGHAGVDIHVQDVCHLFASENNEVLALDHVSLDIPGGVFSTIVGPSGCGKTTLLRIIHGLFKPSSGRVLANGQEVHAPTAEMAMVFQDHNLLPWRNVARNVEFGLELAGVGRRERERRIRGALKLVGLEGFERAYPFQLSGGMRQRVGLARALCLEPQILFMDEPFGALDAQTRELMQLHLLKIWEQFRVTVVFVTHDIDEAVFLSDQVVVMTARPGKIKAVIDIDLPRPRGGNAEKIRNSEAATRHREHIWQLLQPEITGF